MRAIFRQQWTRRALIALGAAWAATACTSGQRQPPKLTRADIRLAIFDYLSAFANAGPQRQVVLFLFSDEPAWEYTYLDDGVWKVTMPASANGMTVLDNQAEWRVFEAGRQVRPSNPGAEAILRGLQAPMPTPTASTG